MGMRHSKRSMDVTTTPKKESLTAEGGDAPAVGDGKLERIEETDSKPTTNGVAPHTDAPEEKDVKDKDATTEKEKDQDDEETKLTEETKAETPAESPAEGAVEVTTPTETTPASPTTVTSPDTKESKKKEKKKKWSFRSISFSKKDKKQPVREDSAKNGDVGKEEPLSEGGEEAENATSPADDKSAVASPTESAAPVEAKEEEASTAEASPEEKKEPSSPTAVPTPVPVEAKKEEVEKTVEVSRVEAVKAAAVVEITKPHSPPSIIERKTSEDFPSLLPSSPPPTPIDPSPLQQAQAAANASALAEALKLPAEAITQSRTSAYVTDDQKNQLESHENDSLPRTNIDVESIKLPEPVETVVEQVLIEELETLPHTSDNDLVIHTEEGPIPISSDTEHTYPTSSVEVTVEIVDSTPQDDSKDEDKEVIVISDLSLSETINEQDNDAETEVAITEIPEDESLSIDKTEEEVPPPLPDSEIPMPKASTDLLNFMTSQIEDAPPLPEIEKTDVTSPLIAETLTPSSAEVVNSQAERVNDSIPSSPVEVISAIKLEDNSEMILESPDVADLPLPPSEVTMDEPVSDSVSPIPDSPIENLLTPPRTPSPSTGPLLPGINGHSIKENENELISDVESMKQNLNSYYDDCKVKDRLAESCEEEIAPNDHSLMHNDQTTEQSIAEPEAPVEKTEAVDDSTTETIEEAPKCQLPTVTPEVPVTVAPVGPAITEDVASVTKAIEEIDINEKAMAMAVNENIESINTNEIIADLNHHNTLKD